MIKNVIIISDFGTIDGGATKVALTSAKKLSQEGMNVLFFCAVSPVDASLEKSGVKVICLNQHDILREKKRVKAVFQGLWNRKSYQELNRLLSGFSSTDTVVHVHTWTKAMSPSVWKALAKNKFPVALTTHDYFSFCPNGGMYNYPRASICDKKALSVPCLLCDCDSRSYAQKLWRVVRQSIQNYWMSRVNDLSIIAISQTTKNLCTPYLSSYSHKVYVLQNPIDLNDNSHVNIIQNKMYLFIARLSREKGLSLFCEALSQLKLPGIVLGDGYLREEMERKYPNIHFAGWVAGAEKETLIRKGKALIFPSLWYEGAPLTVQEIESYGIPCIVPDRCAAAEQVEDGKTGFIFKTGNLESLKEAILKYEQADIAKMQQTLIDTFDAKSLSMETHVKNLLEIYNQILAKN